MGTHLSVLAESFPMNTNMTWHDTYGKKLYNDNMLKNIWFQVIELVGLILLKYFQTFLQKMLK